MAERSPLYRIHGFPESGRGIEADGGFTLPDENSETRCSQERD
jgi:hypothetical protein